MSDNVVDINKNKPKEEFLNGKAKCLKCKHEWQAAAPIGTIWLCCPKCDGEARYLYPVTENKYWQCNCDNFLFVLTPTGTMCAVCGIYATWPNE